ncbi:MAG: hypothetical protein KKD73_03450 [Proteobacteria bacterium]|nr:hypothetical protein [Pseudomonadota bacterium]MBU1640600.1 hypothetical protein [Pseudomonadota bacterium]
MKILHVMRSAAINDDVKKLKEIVSADRENVEFNLAVESPDYAKLVDMVWDADQTICWW